MLKTYHGSCHCGAVRGRYVSINVACLDDVEPAELIDVPTE
jgi:hypothetical protein